MSGFPKEDEAKLLELVAQQQNLFAQIRKLTQEQAGLIASEDVEGLDKSLDRRQKHIEKIKGLHQESDALMQSYISSREAPGGTKIKAIETAAANLREDVTQCAGLDAKNAEALKAKADAYLKQREKLAASRKSIGLYAQGGTNNSELFDKKG
jgi:hypothetical protein